MQVSTHTWQSPAGPNQRSVGTMTPSRSDIVERVDDRPGRQRGGYPRGGRKPPQDEPTTKTTHIQVFMARSLSSTLTALELSSLGDAATMPVAAERSADDAATPEDPRVDDEPLPTKASLDVLLSNMLSAA